MFSFHSSQYLNRFKHDVLPNLLAAFLGESAATFSFASPSDPVQP